jgi:predicted ArsR family transcriptional regulator
MSVLADASRRALYDYVAHAGGPVTREQAAAAMGISRGLAAFHLDKLTDAGLLRARYRSAPDQPRGRGRAPKAYEPTSSEVTASVPEREYGLAARILADAITSAPSDAEGAAAEHARRYGRDLGEQMRTAGVDLPATLARAGYRPSVGDDRIELTNCPFHALAAVHTNLICGLNLAYLTGVLDGLGADRVQASLEPQPGHCCVALRGCQQGPGGCGGHEGQ